jgi:hypothetical protein
MADALASEPLRSVEVVAFGDLFLEDIRRYREDRLATVGKTGCFPLWHRDTTSLARDFVAAGFEAIIVCLDPAKLDRSFAGRRFDARLLVDLPAGVDPCGENGEFRRADHVHPDRGPGGRDGRARRLRVQRPGCLGWGLTRHAGTGSAARVPPGLGHGWNETSGLIFAGKCGNSCVDGSLSPPMSRERATERNA